MLAAIGDGVYQNLEEVSGILAKKNEIIEPDERLVKKYKPLYELYVEGYECLQDFNEKVYDIIHK